MALALIFLWSVLGDTGRLWCEVFPGRGAACGESIQRVTGRQQILLEPLQCSCLQPRKFASLSLVVSLQVTFATC